MRFPCLILLLFLVLAMPASAESVSALPPPAVVRPVVTPVTLPPQLTHVAVSPVVTAPSKGFLNISTTPEGASVFAGGRYIGTTPFECMLAGGNHSLFITLSGYRNSSQVVIIPPYGGIFLTPVLEPLPGTLRIITEPGGASAFADGNYLGVTPVYCEMASGNHTFLVTLGGYRNVSWSASMPPGGQLNRTLRLDPLPGTGGGAAESGGAGAAATVPAVNRSAVPLTQVPANVPVQVNATLSLPGATTGIPAPGSTGAGPVNLSQKVPSVKNEAGLVDSFVGFFSGILTRPDCPPSLRACGKSCVDLQSDPAHCGLCEYSCPAGAVCSGGECFIGRPA
jgi:hypothetical protein